MDLARYTNLLKGAGKSINELSRDELIQLIELIEEMEKRDEVAGLHNWLVPGTPFGIDKLHKHRAALEAPSKYRETLVLGGNRCGKTKLGAMLAAVLATGLYPDWWTGVRFDGPVEIWAVGMSAQTTRDTCQKELIGPVDALGTGLIPKECIGKLAKMSKPADAVESVRIKHVSGKWSTIGFKSYEQSAESFYGTAKHLIWLDEPCPDLVYHESVVRTASTGGKIFHTITPKKGLTRMLADYLAECDLLAGTEALPGLDVARALAEAALSDDELVERELAKSKAPKPSRCAIAIGWDDAPWLDEQTRNDLLAATPPYLRDTVSRGVPSLGHSAVYPVPLDSVLCKPDDMIEIPAHWKRVYGLDVGSKTAAVFLALDPDNDIAYVIGEYYGENQPKEVHAARIKHIAGDWMPGVIDPASRQRSQTDGQKLFDDYSRLGLKLRKADNALTAGLHEVWSRLSQKRLRIWPNTPNLQREYTMYRYDENPSNPKPVKVHDHVMDALRYAVMGLQHAKPKQISSHLNFNFPKGRRYNV